MASRSTPAGESAGRSIPNLPGTLLRRLSQRLGISPTIAMRVALLYGDIEWQAAGALQLRWSASDYARRMGFHRHTVHADFGYLLSLAAVAVHYDARHQPVLQLLGLLPALQSVPDEAVDTPLSMPSPSPCRSFRQPPVDALANPLSKPSTAIEKGLKTQEKKDREKKRGRPACSSKAQEPAEELPGNLQSPDAGASRAQAAGAAAPPEPVAPEAEGSEPNTNAAGTASEPDGTAGTGLLDRLLVAFRDAAPSEWPSPERLTASRERRGRLRQALEHAGSPDALEQRLRAALTHLPAWFRTTYPIRSDGSRRPAYQFFDLMFRASAAERGCGVEAWHLFAWSEGHGGGSGWLASSAPLSADGGQLSDEQRDLHNARRWFFWSSGQWCIRDIQGFKVPAAERRRLTGLLEDRGEGVAGTGAIQFADPEPEAHATEPHLAGPSSQRPA